MRYPGTPLRDVLFSRGDLSLIVASRATDEMFRSTARMLPAQVLLSPFLELTIGLASGCTSREQDRVEILHSIFFDPSYDELVPFLFPLDDGTDSEPSTNLGGNRNLSLCGKPGLSEAHCLNVAQLPGNQAVAEEGGSEVTGTAQPWICVRNSQTYLVFPHGCAVWQCELPATTFYGSLVTSSQSLTNDETR